MNRMPSCVGLTHKQIWQQYKAAYPELPEAELRRSHDHWSRIGDLIQERSPHVVSAASSQSHREG